LGRARVRIAWIMSALQTISTPEKRRVSMADEERRFERPGPVFRLSA
jgi:hypothetical protein